MSTKDDFALIDELEDSKWPDYAGSESDQQKQFRSDMESAARDVEFYNGRYYYKGWAVRTNGLDGLQEAIRDTKVSLQWDELGKDGNIVYPK